MFAYKFTLIFFLSIFSSVSIIAQVKSYWIDDSINVGYRIDHEDSTITDTVFYCKQKSIEGIDAVLYFDKDAKKVAAVYFASKDSCLREYYRNGNLRTVFCGDTISNMILNSWYFDGTVKMKSTIVADTLITISYYKSGKLKQKDVSIRNYFKDNPGAFVYSFAEVWCENGQLTFKDSINRSYIRRRVVYHCNGKRHFEYITNDANFLGKYFEWYENGKLKVEGQYNEVLAEEVKRDFYASKEQGDWRYYYESGKLEKTITFKDGVGMKVKEYPK